MKIFSFSDKVEGFWNKIIDLIASIESPVLKIIATLLYIVGTIIFTIAIPALIIWMLIFLCGLIQNHTLECIVGLILSLIAIWVFMWGVSVLPQNIDSRLS